MRRLPRKLLDASRAERAPKIADDARCRSEHIVVGRAIRYSLGDLTDEIQSAHNIRLERGRLVLLAMHH